LTNPKGDMSCFSQSVSMTKRNNIVLLKNKNSIIRYCYVINYAPETGQPCYRLQIRNVQGSWLRLGLQCEPRETPTEAENFGENSPEYGK
jgi:hypothetical protein